MVSMHVSSHRKAGIVAAQGFPFEVIWSPKSLTVPHCSWSKHYQTSKAKIMAKWIKAMLCYRQHTSTPPCMWKNKHLLDLLLTKYNNSWQNESRPCSAIDSIHRQLLCTSLYVWIGPLLNKIQHCMAGNFCFDLPSIGTCTSQENYVLMDAPAAFTKQLIPDRILFLYSAIP
jgi:hypothetical protein